MRVSPTRMSAAKGQPPLLTDTGVFELGVDVVLPCSVAVEQAMSELVR